MRAFLCVALVACSSLALAHDHGPGSWINNERITDPVTKEWCCSTDDCQEEPTNVQAAAGGFTIISTGELIPTERVIWRSPGGWWRCRYMPGHYLAGKTRCLIGPPSGS